MYDIYNFSKRYGMYFFLLFPTIKTKYKQAQGFTDKTFAHFVLKGHLPDKEKVVL
jgi:hypothetical protein